MTKATQQGAESTEQPDNANPESQEQPKKTPRDLALDALSNRQEEIRAQRIADDIENDPGAASLHKQITDGQKASVKEATGEDLEASEGLEKKPEQPTHEEGTSSVAPMHEEKEENEHLPEKLRNDPLADYIVMKDDKPYMILESYGQPKYIPLDEAKKQLQIGVSAQVRMDNAQRLEADVLSEQREVKKKKQALDARIQALESSQTTLTDAQIVEQAREIFTTAFSSSEEEAAEKLAKLLVATRQPAQVIQNLELDEETENRIVSKASKYVITEQQASSESRELVDAYEQFKDQYPDIIKDPMLHDMADKLTDTIANEHPSWSKTKILLEAGKRTSEWVENLKGSSSEEKPGDVPDKDETASEHAPPPTTQVRTDRKEQLVPMPSASKSAVQNLTKEETRPLTPKEALNEERRARGQMV